EVHAEATEAFAGLFGRRYGPIETYRTEDADVVLVMAGSFSTKGKAAVNRWRAAGKKVGLVRLRLIRPWPAAELVAALGGRHAVGVIDQNLSPGLGGILFHEVAATLAGASNRPAVLRSFIGGLGGKEISPAEFDHVLDVLEAAGLNGSPVAPDLLMTEAEWQQVQGRLAVAGKAVAENLVAEAHP
ncbi:MAG: pyruvate synthase, partial [Planctomycetia bacterium]|nr:pyruvate synthase [Planctomycetia bacterium]